MNVLSQPIVFEICAETLEACLAALPSGADRIELCTSLDVGGLTPAHSLIAQAVKQSGVPVHVLVRPRDGGYNYSDAEFDLICADVLECRSLGASGVVIGVLQADGRVDKKRTTALVKLAAPLEVTFHRAFDATADIDEALEDVIACGCHRILTSGGAPDVLTGAEKLASLVAQAAGRIDIALGGGLRLENAQEVRRITGASHYHSSVGYSPDASPVDANLVEKIRALVQVLRDA
jgi:copper homeostasis protein